MGWGVSILTGINMAFYTISSQWKEGTHTEKRERETERVRHTRSHCWDSPSESIAFLMSRRRLRFALLPLLLLLLGNASVCVWEI